MRASILGINRGDNLFIPKKSDSLLNGDLVYILSDKNHVKRTMSAFGSNEKPIKKNNAQAIQSKYSKWL